jgi:pimeloyl-ACP methyl ester carboxylesterase
MITCAGLSAVVLGLVTVLSPAADSRAVTASAPGATAAPAGVSVLAQPIRHVTVNGASIGYRTAGRGKALVLITGSSSTMAEWDPTMLDALARKHRVIIFDNRGAGTSTGSVQNLTISQLARDTEQLIAEVTQGKADVLGWSMGGYVAQKLVLHFPDRVRRLVLASTDCGGVETIPPRPRALKILEDPDATQTQRMSVLFPKDQLDAANAWTAAITAAFARDGFQPANAFTVSPATAAAQTEAAGTRWLRKGGGTCASLGRITQRVLIGAGKDDVIVPVKNHRRLLHGIARAKARVYGDAGHAFLFQPGLGFTSAVSRFLLADR